MSAMRISRERGSREVGGGCGFMHRMAQFFFLRITPSDILLLAFGGASLMMQMAALSSLRLI